MQAELTYVHLALKYSSLPTYQYNYRRSFIPVLHSAISEKNMNPMFTWPHFSILAPETTGQKLYWKSYQKLLTEYKSAYHFMKAVL